MTEQQTPVIPASIAGRVAKIARMFPAVQYDAFDPYRSAIEAAARAEGLVLVPSEHVQPRTIEGCNPPPAAGDPDEAVRALATVLHEVLCGQEPHREPNYRDHTRASLIMAALGGRGWTLSPTDATA